MTLLSSKMERITLIKAPASRIIDGTGNEFGETLTLIPPTSLQQVASLIRQGTPKSNIEFVDMCAEAPQRGEKYGTFKLGNSLFEKLRIGASFNLINESISRSKIVGLSNNHTFQARIYQDLIKHIKKVNPYTTIVIGGNDVSFRPEFYLDAGADIVVQRRGDSSVPTLLNAISEGMPLEGVPGVIFKDSRGVMQKTPYKRPVFDELPLPDLSISKEYDDLYKQIPEGSLPEIHGKVGYVQSVLGCDMSCYFCTSPKMNGRFQQLTLEQTLELIDHYHKNGIRTNLSIDDNLLLETKTEKGREDLIEQYNYMRKLGWMWYFYDGFQISLLSNKDNLDTELIETLFSHHTNQEGRYIGCAGAYCPVESVTSERKQLKKLANESLELKILSAIATQQPYRLDLGIILTPNAFREMELVRQKLTRYIKTLRKASNYQTLVQLIPFCLEPLPGTRPFREYRGPFDVERDPEAWNGYIDVMEGSLKNTLQRQELQEELNQIGSSYNG